MSISDFLLQRIAEDEEVARTEDGDQPHAAWCGYNLHEGPGMWDGCKCGVPAHIMRECEAKRRIVSQWDLTFSEESGEPLGGQGPETQWDTLRVLASVYAHHPDYREEWKP